jgi:hypothetical protein
MSSARRSKDGSSALSAGEDILKDDDNVLVSIEDIHETKPVTDSLNPTLDTAQMFSMIMLTMNQQKLMMNKMQLQINALDSNNFPASQSQSTPPFVTVRTNLASSPSSTSVSSDVPFIKEQLKLKRYSMSPVPKSKQLASNVATPDPSQRMVVITQTGKPNIKMSNAFSFKEALLFIQQVDNYQKLLLHLTGYLCAMVC